MKTKCIVSFVSAALLVASAKGQTYDWVGPTSGQPSWDNNPSDQNWVNSSAPATRVGFPSGGAAVFDTTLTSALNVALVGGVVAGPISTSAPINASVNFNFSGTGYIADNGLSGAAETSLTLNQGVLLLSNTTPDTYAGPTTLVGRAALVLENDASLGNTAVSVGSPGGNLAGSISVISVSSTVGTTGAGTAGGSLSVTNAQLGLGSDGAGDLTIQDESNFSGNALTLSDSELSFWLQGSTMSLLRVGGPGVASVSGTNNVNIESVVPPVPGTYDLIDVPAGGLTGDFSTNSPYITIGNYRYSYTLTDTDTSLKVTISPGVPLPEPSGLMILGLANMLILRRRR